MSKKYIKIAECKHENYYLLSVMVVQQGSSPEDAWNRLAAALGETLEPTDYEVSVYAVPVDQFADILVCKGQEGPNWEIVSGNCESREGED